MDSQKIIYIIHRRLNKLCVKKLEVYYPLSMKRVSNSTN